MKTAFKNKLDNGENMQYYDELIHELSELCGIIPEYWDIFGKKHVTSLETKKALLRTMKLKIDTTEDLIKEIHERKWRSWKSFIEPVYIKSVNDQPIAIPVFIPIGEAEEAELMFSWSIEDERGHKDEFALAGDSITVLEMQWIDGMRYIKVNLPDVAHRDIGYYKINVNCAYPSPVFQKRAQQKTARLIITPDTCYIPPTLQKGKTWGLSLNLYSIRSNRNWGIGDFTDLKKVVNWVADLKGEFIGINPLHAIPNTKPFGISPYSPVSRLYKNFIYLDIENIPEVAESEDIRAITSSEEFNDGLDELRKGNTVDYEKVKSLKEGILKNAFDVFYKRHYIRNTSRGREFKKYVIEQGATLEPFAIYLALCEHLKKKNNVYIWQEWPEEYHSISGKAVRAFSKAHKKEVLFYQYVQWLIDTQLKEVAEEARKRKMNVGLYYDLAIGSVGGGSDAWSYQDVIAGGADVGAPPDDFNPDGQNWGFPPLIPEKVKEAGYELFIQTIRNNMNYGGAMRIDHALGLFRLFWIPGGMLPKKSAYINYPSEDLLRIIALESNRNRSIVIAEDLGTIGENVRETLRSFKMLSYRLFYFERNYPDPSFILPDMYPDMALCAVTTHDLPTLYGFWEGRDLEVKKQLGLYRDDALWQEKINERERDKRLILSALQSQGIIPDGYLPEMEAIKEMTAELCLAIYEYLALTPCKLLLVSLDDVIGTLNQQNMPGTVDSHPNWIQKTPLAIEKMIADKRFVDLSEMLKRTNRFVIPGIEAS